MKFFAILVILCLFYTLGTDGSASKCYSCDKKCANPLEVKNCEQTTGKTYSCWTSVTGTGTSRVEERKCVENNSFNKNLCEATDKDETSMCKICDTDLCNSAEMFTISVVLLSVATAFITRII